MADKKSNSTLLIAGLVAVLVLGGAYYYYSVMPKPIEDLPGPTTEQEASAVTEKAAPTDAADIAPAAGTIDVAAALSDRILGNPSAPIKVAEHASLTCGHCGAFHRETFGAFKADYIDTGKAYVVFSDFPLNAPALHGTMIARCLPADKYYDFISVLFNEQEQWAYESTYLTYLKAKAEAFGMSGDTFKACLNSKELQDGIVARVTASQKQWDINSTPSFVINNKTVISGGLPPEEFAKAVENGAAGIEQEPAAGEESHDHSHDHTDAPGAEQP